MVKIIITSILLLFTVISSEITTALQKGDSALLSKHFAENVDLTILEEEAVYSKTQAEQIVKKFFEKNSVTKYENAHSGNSRDGSSFVIGNLETSKGKYRTYYLLKGKGDQLKIHTFRIEHSDE